MSAHFIHTLEMNREEVVTHCPSEYLAVVDLDSYPSFVGKEADRLDMMAHLQNQMCALTAVAWGAPGKTLHIRFLLTEHQNALQRVTRAGYSASASGWLRTPGRLCLTSHDRLFDCARQPAHSILKGGSLPTNGRPRILNVPPGTYEVLVYYHFPFPDRDGEAGRSHVDPKADYTVVLHHYPFPAPRAAPTRLPGLALRTKEPSAPPPAGSITSHSKWENVIPASQNGQGF